MISLIAAVDKNNAIGKDNKLLFHIKEDLLFFKETTINHTIIMGRKTFEALPGVLPLRTHIILTRDKSYKVNDPQVKIKSSLKSILEDLKNKDEEVFIIGGGEIFEQVMESGLVDKIYLTKINKSVEDADTFFPQIPNDKFKVIDTKSLTEDAQVFVYERIDL